MFSSIPSHKKSPGVKFSGCKSPISEQKSLRLCVEAATPTLAFHGNKFHWNYTSRDNAVGQVLRGLTLLGRETESSQNGSNVTEQCPHVPQVRLLRSWPTKTSISRDFSSSLYHVHHCSGLEVCTYRSSSDSLLMQQRNF